MPLQDLMFLRGTLRTNASALGLTPFSELDRYLQQHLSQPGTLRATVEQYLRDTRLPPPSSAGPASGSAPLQDLAPVYLRTLGAEAWSQVYLSAVDRAIGEFFNGSSVAAKAMKDGFAGNASNLGRFLTENQDLHMALQFQIRGLTSQAGEQLNAFFTRIQAPEEGRDAFRQLLLHVYRDSQVQRAYTALTHSQADAGALLTVLSGTPESEQTIPRFGHQHMPIFNFRPQQTEMLRVVLQYGNFRPSNQSRILEIGYGTPSILKALSKIHPNRVVGVDVEPVPAVSAQALSGMHLIQGNPPAQPAVAAAVAQRGPYSVIYGADVFRGGEVFGTPFNPGVEPQAYLRWVHDNLEEGGVFIALNDNSAPLLPFTREQILAAGFEIVRWNSSRSVLPEERQMLRQVPGVAQSAGDMSLFVFRRGRFDASQLQVETLSDLQGPPRP